MNAKPRVRAFLSVYAATGNVTAASKAAGISPQAHYQRVKRDPLYAEAFALAHEAFADFIEAEAIRRATVGDEEPIFHGGILVGYKTNRSDGLLQTILKAHRPEKYGQRSEVQVTGANGGPIQSKLEVVFVRPQE